MRWQANAKHSTCLDGQPEHSISQELETGVPGPNFNGSMTGPSAILEMHGCNKLSCSSCL